MLHITTYATDASKTRYLNCPTIKNLAKDGAKWNGFLDKITAVREYLDTVDAEDILCFTDAYDAIGFAGDEEIVEKFKAFGTDVVFSAETSCFPWDHVQQMYPYSPTIYKYLNSGGYIGYVHALRTMLSHSISEFPCDQGFFTYYYINSIHNSHVLKTRLKIVHYAPPSYELKNSPATPPHIPNITIPLRMCLDTGCVLFQTAYAIPWSHFRVREGRLWNVVMNTKPCFIHFNGNQHHMKDGSSLMPLIYEAVHGASGEDVGFDGYAQKYPSLSPIPARRLEMDGAIIELARANAARYKLPDQTRIHERDFENYHAIFKGAQFIHRVYPESFEHKFTTTNRGIIEGFLRLIQPRSELLMDVTLHDYTGVEMNNSRWSHSIFAFSTNIADDVNILIPDLYAMQNYKGSIDRNNVDTLPFKKKINKIVFIGSTHGMNTVEHNERVQLCKFAKDKSWIDSYISTIVNIPQKYAPQLADYMHDMMSQYEQYTYRHIASVDGNTACWDRVVWVMASNSVLWKMDSEDQCWYYPFLKPWVHYIPFNLENLTETWERVKDDTEMHREIIKNANQFVEDYLRPCGHMLYTRTLMDAITERYADAVIRGPDMFCTVQEAPAASAPAASGPSVKVTAV